MMNATVTYQALDLTPAAATTPIHDDRRLGVVIQQEIALSDVHVPTLVNFHDSSVINCRIVI